MTFDGLYVYADGKYEKMGHIDAIEITAEDVEEDIRTLCPVEQTFECEVEPVSWYRLMRHIGFMNNWRRYHGMKPKRWRTLERIVK